jgi:hypothetical protein
MGIETKRKWRTPKDWHTVSTEKANHWRATDWCTKQFGQRWSVVDNRDGVWCCFWAGREQFESYRWYFENECDAIWFTLRWS